MTTFFKCCFYILLCLLFCNCRFEQLNQEAKLQQFSLELYQQLTVASKVQFYNSHLFNSDLEVNKPVYTWIPLLGFEFFSITADDIGKRKHACLYFRVPKNSTLGGDLRLMNQDDNQCQGVHVGTMAVELLDISHLKLYFSSDSKMRKMLAPAQNPFTMSSLYLKFNYFKQVINWDIPMLNILLDPQVAADNKKSIDSFFIWGSLNQAKQDATLIGNETDNYLDHTSKACHLMDQKCNETLKFECDRCLYGWFETVGDNVCPQGGNKYCGQDRCGQRGQPACPNSLVSSGFCQPGLEAHLDGNQVYVCL